MMILLNSEIARLLDEVFVENKKFPLLILILTQMKGDECDYEGNTILHYAAKTKDIRKMKMTAEAIDSKTRSAIDKINNWGQHAFHVAAEYSSVEVIRFFVKWSEIDINIKMDVNGFTALHIAVWYLRYDIVEYFCKECYNVDFNAIDICNRTAYILAKKSGNEKLIDLFKKYVFSVTCPCMAITSYPEILALNYKEKYEKYEHDEK